MTAAAPDNQVNGAFDAAMMRALLAPGPIKYLSFSQGPKLTRRVSKVFNANASIGQIWLWLAVTRNALNDVISVSNLEVLDVFRLCPPGQLHRFENAAALQVSGVQTN